MIAALLLVLAADPHVIIETSAGHGGEASHDRE